MSKSNIVKTMNTELINKIRTELVEPTYYSDVKYNIGSKSRWKFIGDLTETLSRIFSGLGTILAFAAGFFNYSLFSFIAGCFGITSLVLLQFSSYSMKESKERTDQVNILLEQIGIDKIANIAIDSSIDTSVNTSIDTSVLVRPNNLELSPNDPVLSRNNPNNSINNNLIVHDV